MLDDIVGLAVRNVYHFSCLFSGQKAHAGREVQALYLLILCIFMANWHKEEEEASRQRAAKRDNKTRSVDAAKNKGTGKGKRKGETAKEESERELADRVARHVAD